MSNEVRIDEVVEFAENPEPRCPCVLLLDTSNSMKGTPIAALNDGLKSFQRDLNRDALASKRVEVAVVTFNSKVVIVQDFITAEQFDPPVLSARGYTYMGAAIHQALDMIEARKEQYRTNGIVYYRPWVFMITDGEPQGEPEDVVKMAGDRIKEDEKNKRVAFFAVGVGKANMGRLGEIAVRAPVKLKGLNFVDMFQWLSRSMQAVSHSRVGDQVALPPAGWSIV